MPGAAEMSHDSKEFQEFLQKKQYSVNSVLRYEWIFGNGFISTGGPHTTVQIVEKLGLSGGERLLDVGCGIGGGDVFIADKYNVKVHGVDLSETCVAIAREKYGGHPNVTFELADCTTMALPPASLDVVYSRDALIHIPDKPALFKQFAKWLKPGGKVLITDYCCGPREQWDEEFTAYIKDRGYSLLTIRDYQSALESAGLRVLEAADKVDYFVDILKDELNRLQTGKEDFLSKFSLQDYKDLEEGWESKIVRCGKGLQKWAVFLAIKMEAEGE